MFQSLDHLIKRHGDDAEDHDGCDYHVKLEDLGSIDDQISQSSAGSEEFTDNYAYQGEADIHFHIAENSGDGTGEYHL